MSTSLRPKSSYPRPLILCAEAQRRIRRDLRCDGGEALAWLKCQIRVTSIEAYRGSFRLAYHKDDPSDAARNAFWRLEHPISYSDVDEDSGLDWSNVSIDEADLEKALAQELLDTNEPIEAGPPPEQSVVFAVALERVRKASGYGEAAATGYLKDQLFRQGCVLSWTCPTRGTPFWQRATESSNPQLVYVMEAALEQALACDFPHAENLPGSFSDTIASTEHERSDPESRCLEWLKSEMRKSPDRSPKPKRDLLSEAVQRFPELSMRSVRDRVWPRALKETSAAWGKPGRKSYR